jgi:excisionase family DNA binding protein
MKALLNVQETADQLGIKPATVRAWLLRRKLPCVHVGRAVRIPADAIAQFIERNTVPAREEHSLTAFMHRVQTDRTTVEVARAVSA